MNGFASQIISGTPVWVWGILAALVALGVQPGDAVCILGFNRPEWTRYINYIKKRNLKSNLVLFTKWDRFSRNAGDAYQMIKLLLNNNENFDNVNFDIFKKKFIKCLHRC